MDLIFLINEKPKNIYGFLIGGKLYDIRDSYEGPKENIFAIERTDEYGLDIARHSMAHLLAQSILDLYPSAKIAVGPTTDYGFFYDVDLDVNLTFEDLKTIEDQMNKNIENNAIIEKKILKRSEAIHIFKHQNQDYKVILLEQINDDTVTVYAQGNFLDLCRGPHVYSTGSIPRFFNLYNVGQVDWAKGGPKDRLQRIYGLGFTSKEDLKNHLKIQEEQKKSDHRKIGWDHGLVSFHPEFCSGGAFWEPKGFIIYNEIIQYIRKTITHHGYVEVRTPQMYNENLWKLSGHWDHYSDNMFKIPTNGEEIQYISPKPMNCPAHIVLFKSRLRSYKDLPLRMAEFGSCCRNESSGSLDGLMRMREFVQDDAHIFCREDQIQEETIGFCQLLEEVYNKLGFNKIKVVISTRPVKSFGSDEVWKKAEQSLMDAMAHLGWSYTISPGDGAFYGPKLEFSLQDRMGRYWQCGTFQVDFVLPERMGAHYVDNTSTQQTPIICHRAILGSLERFLGILIENNKGNFPFWLAPVQMVIMNIGEDQGAYGLKIYNYWKDKFRCTFYNQGETLGKKIKTAINERIPILVTVGNNEMEGSTMAIRNIKGDQQIIPWDDVAGLNQLIDQWQL
jgi:threonyl-tRNA synthetase